MDSLIICLIPLLYSALLLWVGWLLGKHGSPVRWVGFHRSARQPPAASKTVRVAKEYD